VLIENRGFMIELLAKAIKNRDQIFEGLKNNALSVAGLSDEKKEMIFSERKKICDACPLYKDGRCDEKKVIATDDLTVEKFDRDNMDLVVLEEGYPREYYMTKDFKQVYRGCGCFIKVKHKSEHAYCPAGFWGGEFDDF